ncbi:MAG: sigma-54-dependent Fis family transcriptional regulator [Deltaproteobacteria bacterium]|nr:sigma-54-dependent Fis family transcriptional regulator [Deltaproteobacteria bacterium]
MTLPPASADPPVRDDACLGRLFARSELMRATLGRLSTVASGETTVLIEGETGTGKELAAEAIHEESPRRGGPLIVVDCAAVPAELIESELFGHRRGAFTGAFADREGAFEAARRGTVFIDEVGELPLTLQARLLGVLERRQIKRVGDDVVRPVDVRLVAATNRDLEAEVEAGRFRKDLYFRLAVVKIRLPPLRQRPEDLEMLVERFLSSTLSATGQPIRIKPEELRRLAQYSWPGNVRELRNVIDRGASMADEWFRVPDDFDVGLGLTVPSAEVGEPEATDPHPAPPALRAALTEPLWRDLPYKEARQRVLDDFERGWLTALLRKHAGNVSSAAREAGIHRNILHRMIARYKMGNER